MPHNLLPRLANFARKPYSDQILTIRYFSRQALSRLPYLFLPMHFPMSESSSLHFWWSYLPSDFQPTRSIFTYWGTDIGELRFLATIMQPGFVFFDIGSYHGIYSLIAALTTRGSTVIAFEPSLRERKRIALHLRLNGLRNVSVEGSALASHTGIGELFLVTSDRTTMSSLRPPFGQHQLIRVPVGTTTLDDYCARNDIARLDILKIDAEGAELDIFRSASHVLSTYRPIIICEVLDKVTAQWGYPAQDIIKHLERYNYRWFDTKEDGSVIIHKKLDYYNGHLNYIAIPEEKLQALSSLVMAR